MANLLAGGIIATVAFVAVGVVLVLPPYIQGLESSQQVPKILLSFSVTDDENMPQWCKGISELLNENQLKAAVFFSGKAAERYPDCVRSFNDYVEIGSSTYSYTKLSAERDYLDQLNDVSKGKAVVDSLSGTNSQLFKAPYGYSDDNIYSLLSRNNITLDFSANGSYNKFDGNYFIYNELKTFDLGPSSINEIQSHISNRASDRVQITADSSVPVEKITSIVNFIIRENNATFVNASEMAGTHSYVGVE